MAEEGNIFTAGGSGSDHQPRWPRGSASDVDHRWGNQWNSWTYARVRDPRSEQEYSSHFLDAKGRIVNADIERHLRYQERHAHEAMLNAQNAVHFWPSIGKFIIPQTDDGQLLNTWAAHAEMVKDDRNSLYFNPEKYVFFDKIVAEEFGNPALWDPSHRNYAKYEGLRTNLEVLRNDIIGIFLNDGSFDPGDEVYVPTIQSIAKTIGQALANDHPLKRPFTRSLSVDIANVEGVGAAEIYKYLLSVQSKDDMFANVRQNINIMLGMPDRNWGLPPLEETPFSPENLAAAPPRHDLRFANEQEFKDACANQGVQPQAQGPDAQAAAPAAIPTDPAERIAYISEWLGDTAYRLRSIESLEDPPREESIEEARKILRYLKNLQHTDKDMEEWLGHGTPAEQIAKAEALEQLARIYAVQWREAKKLTPGAFENDLLIDSANGAITAIALTVAEHARATLPADHPGIRRLDDMIDALPYSCEEHCHHPVERLLEHLETGLEHVTGAPVAALTPVERLVEMSNRIQATARKLRSVDSMEPPAREESVDLGRKILEKLRNLSFSDRPIEELIHTGTPSEKAILAQKLDEMVDIYKNLLFEAAQITPSILDDPRIKDANDAVGSFAFAVKLMAAKELPNSVAAAQQISADVTQTPEEWKQLHDRTIGRLVKSMEGGLERAVIEVQQQQQEQQQDDEIAQAVIDAHMEHGRKRKRRRSQRTGFGAKKMQKTILDLTADDYVLKQGRFAQERTRPAADETRSASTMAKIEKTEKTGKDKSAKMHKTVLAMSADDYQLEQGRFAKAKQADIGVTPGMKGTAIDKAVKTAKETSFMQGLKPADMEAIKKLGGDLLRSGDQVKNLPVASVAAGETVSPDDKTFAMRNKEEIERHQRNGQNGPRVG